MAVLQFIVAIIVAYIIAGILHAAKLFLLKNGREPLPCKRPNAPKTMIIMGSGGHTGEMLRLLASIDFRLYSSRCYVIAKTDSTSAKRVHHLESSRPHGDYQICTISRSREVSQSWITSTITTFQSFLESVWVVLSNRPDLVLCNGPGTCVPPCLVSFILKAFWVKRSTILFVESVCRVSTLSLTGKIMVHFLADRSLVQWPELHAKYPRTVYLGRLV